MAGAEPGFEVSDLHFSGFGTFGLTHSNAPAGTNFHRDMSERLNQGGTRADTDTRLGAQVNYKASSQFEFVGQVVGANRGAAQPPSDFLTLAFAAWRPSDDWTVRLGRMSTDYFLLADYRHVGFAYPFVRPPIEYYSSLPYAADGIDLTRAWRSDGITWRLRGVVGHSRFITDQSGTAVTLRPGYTLVLSREDDDGLLLKATVVRARVHTDLAAAQPLLKGLGQIAGLGVQPVADDARTYAGVLSVDGQYINYFSAGAGYDRGPWLASLEVNRAARSTAGSYGSAWGLVGHRWGAVTGYTGMSAIRTDQSRTPPDWRAALTPVVGAAGAAQAQQLGMIAFSAASQTNATQRTFTLGMRWDFSDRAAVKLQWDRSRVDAYGGRIWSSMTGEPIHANVESATLDFVF